MTSTRLLCHSRSPQPHTKRILRTTAPLRNPQNFKMGRRQRLISTSILRAIFRTRSRKDNPSLLTRILAFFSIFQLGLARYREAVFKKLRNEIWGIEEEEYTESFRSPSGGKRTDLNAIGDLGYSGSVGSISYNSSFNC